jgi:uncharacterized protein (DUF2267 family)
VDHREFIESVQKRANVSEDEAERLTRVTMTVLADRITGGEAEDLAAQLPRGMRDYLVSRREEAEKFDLEEFIRRVSERAGVDVETATRGVRAVLSTVRRAVTSGEFEDVLAQLPKEFAEFID